MKKILVSLSMIALFSFLLAGCSTTTDLAEAYRGESPQQIYQRGKEALRRGSNSEAIKRFEALEIQYPYGAYTENAQLFLIYAYYMKDEYPLAVASADRFIRTNPANPHIDYVYYIRGLADYYQNIGFLERLFAVDLATRDLTQIQKSYNDFNELVLRFPYSPYAPSAHQYMIYLRNVLANHELEVAQYYYNRRAYIAAANRASGLVAHFQGTPSVLNALVLMVKAYHQLGLTRLEQDALAVLHYNYPNVIVNYNVTYPE
jgi:outer membrane protein assembly factor BamD